MRNILKVAGLLVAIIFSAVVSTTAPSHARQGCEQVPWASWCKTSGFTDKASYRSSYSHDRVKNVKAPLPPRRGSKGPDCTTDSWYSWCNTTQVNRKKVSYVAKKKVISRKKRKKRTASTVSKPKWGRLPSSVRTALAKVRANCSGYRSMGIYANRNIAGSRRKSLHAHWMAADFAVNDYSCALKQLSRVPGIGYSRDGDRCGHIHVSDGRSIGRAEPRGFRHRRC